MNKFRLLHNKAIQPRPSKWSTEHYSRLPTKKYSWSTWATKLLARTKGGLFVIAILSALGHDQIIMIANQVAGCTIKGNISLYTEKHIYHMPGQPSYNQTIINFRKGERWFCSEEEARAAGWRKPGEKQITHFS